MIIISNGKIYNNRINSNQNLTMLPDCSVLLLTDILSGALCPVVPNKKKTKVKCPH